MKIFVSYSSSRRTQAEPVVMAMRSRGHEVFFDRDDLPPGGTYHDQIASAIEASHLIVFLLSKEFVQEGRYTLSELELVRKRWPNPNKHVLPVLLDPLPVDTLPAYLREVTLLQPAGNLAAEVAASVDDLGWQGLSKSAASVAAGGLAGLALFGAVATAFLKGQCFDCWSWRGMLTDSKSLLFVLLAFAPFLAFVWGLSRLRAGYDLAARTIAHLLEGRPAQGFAACTIAGVVAAGALLIALPRPSCSARLEAFVVDGNWDSATQELSRLKSQPLRADISDTLSLYLRNAQTAAHYGQEAITILREDRASLLTLLRNKRDYQNLATFSFANNSRSISMQEDDPAAIDEAVTHLKRLLEKMKSPPEQGAVWQKLAELYRARGDSAACLDAADKAINLLPPGPRQSAVHANAGAAQARAGNFDSAIAHYRAAEAYYPEGGRYVFYSNLGYIYMLAKRYDESEQMILRALKINGQDWVSYMNLALLYEKMDRPEDAVLTFRKVVKDAPPGLDASREAWLLLARMLEIARASQTEILSTQLLALGRSNDTSVIERLKTNPAARAKLYFDLAKAMRQINTDGIEQYIDWFEKRASESAR